MNVHGGKSQANPSIQDQRRESLQFSQMSISLANRNISIASIMERLADKDILAPPTLLDCSNGVLTFQL